MLQNSPGREDGDKENRAGYAQKSIFTVNQQKAVKSALQDYDVDVPVIFNMNFGHTDPQIIIPNGGHVKINGSLKTIEFY